MKRMEKALIAEDQVRLIFDWPQCDQILRKFHHFGATLCYKTLALLKRLNYYLAKC